MLYCQFASPCRKLFELLQERLGADNSIFLLTTDLCPAHRLATVAEIKRRQREEARCIVVATQCIEAGVDLDFDRMFRAMAPLESVIQAAGRCNRNGRLPGGGCLTIFRPEEEGRLYPGDSYERGASVVMNLWADCDNPELSDPALVQRYYARYFSGETGEGKLEEAIQKKNYKEAAKKQQTDQKRGRFPHCTVGRSGKAFSKGQPRSRGGRRHGRAAARGGSYYHHML